jgi:hypothetical protein
MIDDIKQFFFDMFAFGLDVILFIPFTLFGYWVDGVLAVFNAIELPDTINVDIASLFPTDITWVLIQSGFPDALSVIGVAISFRIVRRFATLGIW